MRNKWKISSRIMVAIMVCSATLGAVIGSITLYQAGRLVEKNTYDNLRLAAESYANEFSKTTVSVESVLDSYLSAISATFSAEQARNEQDAYVAEYQDDILLPLTQQYAVNTSGILGIYFDVDPSVTPGLGPDDRVYGAWYLDKYKSGKVVREHLEFKRNFFQGNTEMAWYFAPVDKGEGVWSKPYKDIYTGYYMISYNKPLYMEGAFIGVAGIDIVFEDIIKLINKVAMFDTGFAYLLDPDYDIIAHPTVNYLDGERAVKITDVDADYGLLVAASKGNQSGTFEMGGKYNKKVLSYARMSNDYIVIIEVQSSEILEELNRTRAVVDAVILAGIILAAVIAYFLGKYISKPVDILEREIAKMMHFDFTAASRKLPPVDAAVTERRRDPVVVSELDKLRESVNHSVVMIRNNANIINIQKEELEHIAEEFERIVGRFELLIGNSELFAGTAEESLRLQKAMLDQLREIAERLAKANDSSLRIIDLYKTD